MSKTVSGLNPEDFKGVVRGKSCDLYVLKNSKGSEACLSNFGAILVSYCVADKNGKMTDIVLGQPKLSCYTEHPDRFLGATVGRYCNRIAKGKFQINGKEYSLPINNGPNNLHSGETGFHNQVFDVVEHSSNSVHFVHSSPAGENGFPGCVTVNQTWTLNDDNELVIHTLGTTDAPTVVSITNHSFFNLEGGNTDALGAKLQLNADFYLPSDENMIPTGEVRPVAGTNFDFRKPEAIGSRINDKNDEQLVIGAGYDHTFVLNKHHIGELTNGAIAHSDKTGITLEVKTTLPGVQLYTGNYLDGCDGKVPGTKNNYRYAFCLEAQFFPDSPNKGHFPSSLLYPCQRYDHTIVFKAYAE